MRGGGVGRGRRISKEHTLRGDSIALLLPHGVSQCIGSHSLSVSVGALLDLHVQTEKCVPQERRTERKAKMLCRVQPSLTSHET